MAMASGGAPLLEGQSPYIQSDAQGQYADFRGGPHLSDRSRLEGVARQSTARNSGPKQSCLQTLDEAESGPSRT